MPGAGDMRLIDAGTLAAGTPGTDWSVLSFPSLMLTGSGVLLATMRAGRSKDCDDERIELMRSTDGGRSWSQPEEPFRPLTVDGHHGSLKLCYLTETAPGRILAAAMWIDRAAHPGKPLFNAETEGCLPMAIALCDSRDDGRTFSDWRVVPMPAELGPLSLTSPILCLADGRLAMSIETNKSYFDAGPWRQKAVFLYSQDGGQTWSAPVPVAEDPSSRIFNWDLRCAVAPDGRVATFAWTYDTQAKRYLDVHRRLSADHGARWTAPEPLGLADQAGRPAMLPDGRVLLPYVDRFGAHAIKVRLAAAPDAPFAPETEVTLYDHAGAGAIGNDTGALLADMEMWSFGLPFAEALGGGEVLVLYYAGTSARMDIRYARLSV